MNIQVVLCPNKKCEHRFATEKVEPQCGKCGSRFDAVSNVLDVDNSQNKIIKEQYENQIQKIENILEKLSSQHQEAGIAIKEIHKITREAIRK